MPYRTPRHQQEQGRRDTQRMYGQKRRNDAEQRVYSSQRWKQLRRRVFAREPLCADPEGRHEAEGRVVLAIEVDHIISLDQDKRLAFVLSNLQGLCRACHGRKTREDNRKKVVANRT